MSAVATRVHAPEPSHVRLGVLLFIVSEVMLFGGLFAAYFALRGASATWPPTAISEVANRSWFFR
ncbi:MAG: cytochrome c oxidase subunit 3, partial [Chloroflexota bacterium]